MQLCVKEKQERISIFTHSTFHTSFLFLNGIYCNIIDFIITLTFQIPRTLINENITRAVKHVFTYFRLWPRCIYNNIRLMQYVSKRMTFCACVRLTRSHICFVAYAY